LMTLINTNLVEFHEFRAVQSMRGVDVQMWGCAGK